MGRLPLLPEVPGFSLQHDIECLKGAAKIANMGMAAARTTIGEGVSELEVYGEIERAMSRVRGNNPGITMPVLPGTKNEPAARACDAAEDEAWRVGAGGPVGRL